MRIEELEAKIRKIQSQMHGVVAAGSNDSAPAARRVPLQFDGRQNFAMCPALIQTIVLCVTDWIEDLCNHQASNLSETWLDLNGQNVLSALCVLVELLEVHFAKEAEQTRRLEWSTEQVDVLRRQWQETQLALETVTRSTEHLASRLIDKEVPVFFSIPFRLIVKSADCIE